MLELLFTTGIIIVLMSIIVWLIMYIAYMFLGWFSHTFEKIENVVVALLALGFATTSFTVVVAFIKGVNI